jgi:hypothetical protein
MAANFEDGRGEHNAEVEESIANTVVSLAPKSCVSSVS